MRGSGRSGSIRLGSTRIDPDRPGPLINPAVGRRAFALERLLAVIGSGWLFFWHVFRGGAPPGARCHRRLHPSSERPPASGHHAADPQALPRGVPAARRAGGRYRRCLARRADGSRTRRTWLADASAGKTRTRNSLYGPEAAAYSNSMRVRIDSYNAFAEFLGLPDRLDSQAPASGFYLTPADTERLLHDLAVRRPVHANAATALRTAAVAALVADTGRNVPELARLKVSALHLDGEAHVEARRRIVPARQRYRADPEPLAPRPGGDHRRARGQRSRSSVDPDQARATSRRPAAGQARPDPRGCPHPSCRSPHPRQPGARHPAPARRLPRVSAVTVPRGSRMTPPARPAERRQDGRRRFRRSRRLPRWQGEDGGLAA